MVWWIQSVYVAPIARRRGVFRALYEHAKARSPGTGRRWASVVCGRHQQSRAGRLCGPWDEGRSLPRLRRHVRRAGAQSVGRRQEGQDESAHANCRSVVSRLGESPVSSLAGRRPYGRYRRQRSEGRPIFRASPGSPRTCTATSSSIQPSVVSRRTISSSSRPAACWSPKDKGRWTTFVASSQTSRPSLRNRSNTSSWDLNMAITRAETRRFRTA